MGGKYNNFEKFKFLVDWTGNVWNLSIQCMDYSGIKMTIGKNSLTAICQVRY